MTGRKRHILVDSNGRLLKVTVHSAALQDSDGGRLLLSGLGQHFPRLQHLWADAGYKKAFIEWVVASLHWTVEIVRPPHRPTGEYATLLRNFLGDAEFERRYPIGFQVLPRRWVVERTFAWIVRHRRLAKDVELYPLTSETWIYLLMSRLMLKRIASHS